MRSLARRALANARSASALLVGQITERQALAPDDDDGPGMLSRIDGETCLTLLRSRDLGRLAYIARAGVPDIVPVNYAVHQDGLLLRSGPGPKLQAAQRRERVAVEVDEIDPVTRIGWSVVAAGRARQLSPAEVQALDPATLPAPWAMGLRSAVVLVTIERLDGRRLH